MAAHAPHAARARRALPSVLEYYLAVDCCREEELSRDLVADRGDPFRAGTNTIDACMCRGSTNQRFLWAN
jgi:hypothetical protein